MTENIRKKPHRGHSRSGSLFSSASNVFGGANNSMNSTSSNNKMNTYGKKRNVSGHRSVLTQSHIEHTLWTQKDNNNLEMPEDNNYNKSDSITTSNSVVGLGVLDFEESTSWESETTQVLTKISQPRPNSTVLENNGSGDNSKMVRAFSNRSTSSKSTVEPGNSKHTSMSSTVSTINNKHVTRISVIDTQQQQQSGANSNSNSRRASHNNSNNLPHDDSETNLSIKQRRSSNVNPNLTLVLGDNDENSTESTASSFDDKENNEDLDLPKIPALTDSSTTPIMTPTSTSSLQSKDSKASPSAASFLSFKKDPKDLKHRKVSKCNISGPGNLVDTNDFFSDTSSATTASNNNNTASTSPTNDNPIRRRKRRSNHKNTSSVFSSISSSASFFSTGNNNTTPKISPPSANGGVPNRKSSLADIKKSFLNFSSSSSAFFKQHTSSTSSPKTHVNNNSNHHNHQDQDENEKPVISLPTPNDTSREKLRNKLRASNSLLSLARSETSNSLVAVPAEQFQQSQLDTLLGLCNSSSIYEFSEYVSDTIKTVEMNKLAEASFSEVFIQKDKHKNTSKIYKIIPFGNEELEQLPMQDIIQELSIARLLMSLDGFVDVIDAAVVKGVYPDYLLNKWDEYGQHNKTENYRPDFYKSDQLYCIMVLSDAGTDLEHFTLNSWLEAETIFWQTVNSLSNAEEKYQFEHRDLHWGNLVISTKNNKSTGEVTKLLEKLDIEDVSKKPTDDGYDDYDEFSYDHTDLKVTMIDYTLSRATNTEGSIIYTRLDHPDFFRGKGDYQFDIYRFMRSQISTLHVMNNATTSNSLPASPMMNNNNGSNTNVNENSGGGIPEMDWSIYCGKSNILWLHYIVDKLLHGKGLEKVTATRSGRLSSGGSNSSLRGGGGSKNGNLTEEARACKALELIHQSIDPRKKKFKKQHGQMTFQDFESSGHLLTWGLQSGIISQELIDLLDLKK